MRNSSLNNSFFSIGKRIIGEGQPPFIIAEVAQAHDGSLGVAHSFIDAVAQTGADAIKFQTHLADAESTREEPFRIQFSYEDKTRYDYWKRMEFTPSQWKKLAEHAGSAGLAFLSSPFSIPAVDILNSLNVPAWKIGSGEFNNFELIDCLIQTGKPLLMSTGMSSWNEIDQTTQKLKEANYPFALLQCTSSYPTPLEKVGLNLIKEMQERYEVPIGLSDHSGQIFPALAAMTMEANIIEVHVTFHKQMFGPDTPASLTLEQLKQIIEARDAFHKMKINPVNKDDMATEMIPMKKLFNKSVALKKAVKAGSILKKEVLTTKKPGVGIPASQLNDCVGLVVKVDLPANQILNWDDLTQGSS